jgi:NADH-quinone oxidoreductase subunit H
MRFGFFALAEYIEVFVVCGLAVALFLGGYNVPMHLGGDGLIGQALQVGAFLSKTFVLYYIVIMTRWTLPRLRVDQLMTMCWKYLIHISMFNLIMVGLWMWLFDGKSLFTLLFKSAAVASGAGH